MQDKPTPSELLAAVASFLRETVMPQLKGDTQFHTRVAANALDLARREIDLGAQGHAAELARLQDLLKTSGTLEDLNRLLCQRIADGIFAPCDDKLINHLWRTTLEKLAVDQPSYAAYKRALEEYQS